MAVGSILGLIACGVVALCFVPLIRARIRQWRIDKNRAKQECEAIEEKQAALKRGEINYHEAFQDILDIVNPAFADARKKLDDTRKELFGE